MNYYELLEISSDASIEVIEAAYKAQVKKYHPDNQNSGDAEKMAKINNAYETLSNPTLRAEYDRKMKIERDSDYVKHDKNQRDKAKEDEKKYDAVQGKMEEDVQKMPWYLSGIVILILSIYVLPIGLILLFLRILKLGRKKDLYKRKKKIQHTWILAATSFLMCLIYWEAFNAETVTTESQHESIQEDSTEVVAIQNSEIVEEIIETPTDNTASEEISKEEMRVYSEDAIQESLKSYSYEENPYYLEGIQLFVDSFNEMYETLGAKQKIEILALDDVLKEAGISRAMRKKILASEGKNILSDKDFLRMEEKKTASIFGSKGSYLEVSSKAKDDIDEINALTTIYYLGDLEDNKPDGEGALFKITDTGIRLLYAGEFEKGRGNGKGVIFATDTLGYVLTEYGNYENNLKNGKCITYNAYDIVQLYKLYRESWIEYEEQYYGTYSKSDKEKVLTNLFENDTTAELMYASAKYEVQDAEGLFSVRVNYPVIRPAISYKGSYKKGDFSGKGILYGSAGTLWYEGEFKNGKFNGQGTLYYALTGIAQYEGMFTNSKLDGQGTLYNEDGTVRKKGNFDREEIDLDNELAETYGIYQGVYEKYEEVGLQIFFEKDKLIANEEDTPADYEDDYYEDEYYEDEYYEDGYDEDEWDENSSIEDDSMKSIIVLEDYISFEQSAEEIAQKLRENGVEISNNGYDEFQSDDGSLTVRNTDMGAVQIELSPWGTENFSICGVNTQMSLEEANQILCDKGAENVTSTDEADTKVYIIDGKYTLTIYGVGGESEIEIYLDAYLLDTY